MNKLRLFSAVLSSLFPLMVSAQDNSNHFSTTNSLDHTIIHGKLENGFSYFIKPLPNTEDEISLRFLVKAGSKHQDPDQQNMAHFLEHMAFKSSENFPNGIRNETKLLNRLGISHLDFSATSGTHNTTYWMFTPPDNEEALETAFIWFRDIAVGLNLDKEEVDSERGIMIQEVIVRTNDNIEESISRNSLESQLVPCRENQSNFIEHHKTFPVQRLEDYYNDWYRPELMMIAAVGKIDDVSSMKKKIVDYFSKIPSSKNPRKTPSCDSLFFQRPPQFEVLEKRNVLSNKTESTEINLLFRDKETHEMISGIEKIQHQIVLRLFLNIMNKRFSESSNGYNNYFSIRMEHTYSSERFPSSFRVQLSAWENKEKKGLETVGHCLAQLRKYGLLEAEFQDAKKSEIRLLDRLKTDSSQHWVSEIEKYFVHGESLPKGKFGKIKNWLGNYTFEEFQSFIGNINLDMPEDIGILAPTDHIALSFTEKNVRGWITEIDEDKVRPYSLPEFPSSLMTKSEIEILNEHNYEDKGVGEAGERIIKLANGVKVALKSFTPSPGPYKEKIILHGFKNRGALDFDSQDYYSAINAPMFIKHSGVSNFDKFELQRFMTGSSLLLDGIHLYIKNHETGIKIDSDLKDLETLLQLVYLYFTQPRLIPAAYTDWLVCEKLNFENQISDTKQVDLSNSIRRLIGDDSDVVRGTERYIGLKKTDMEKGLKIYQELVGNGQGFTFLLTGDFQVDSVMPLVNKYLGNLGSFDPKEEAYVTQNVFPRIPNGPVYVEFKSEDSFKKLNYSYNTFFFVPTIANTDWKEKIMVETLGLVLNTRLRNLRYKKGFSLYSVRAVGRHNKYNLHFEIESNLNCPPDQFPLLRTEYSRLINDLRTNIIPSESLNSVKSTMTSRYNPTGTGNTNLIMQEKMYRHYNNREPWISNTKIIEFVNTISERDILRAAKEYLKPAYFYEFVLVD